MRELLQQYSLQDILIFLVIFAVAFKSVVSFWEWLIEWIKKNFDKKNNKELESRVDTIYNMTANQEERMQKMEKALDLLIRSDKDNIKSWIVERHHYFCYKVGAIDYFSLESIERRYEYYQKEDGNSYVSTLVAELKALPKIENESVLKTKATYENSIKG